ncbi:MAG TPA: GGDEF domain-containing protein [Xanthobacteraceae bacterium]|nr:GGDEF domain-containing protein [Xanthobacteraceae bacterium]
MSLQGPIFVVADRPVPELLSSLTVAGAFPIIEIGQSELVAKLAEIEPAAIVLVEPPSAGLDLAAIMPIRWAGERPYVPAIATADGPSTAWLGVLICADDRPGRLTARLRAALRVRTLHATVLRRIASIEEAARVPTMPDGDPLEDATVLVAGRGGSYPALVVAVAERSGLVGALSLDAAAHLLRSRDIDGLVIGDGFNKRSVMAFVDELAADARFRDLPIVVTDGLASGIDPERLPNLIYVAGEPKTAINHLIPLVRLRAFTGRLRRMMASLDAKGSLDPDTGLHRTDAFLRDLARTISDAEKHGTALSLARFSLASLTDWRASHDAARIVARLVRGVDFGCRDEDGTILVAFTETDQRAAHVVARRIASVLKHTTLLAGHDRRQLDPTVTIAAFKRQDTPRTLLARV